jgi:Zn-dependent metalloprotease/N-acetylneuraminic acid mutarotase/fibronectin type 3 domain-containing protein
MLVFIALATILISGSGSSVSAQGSAQSATQDISGLLAQCSTSQSEIGYNEQTGKVSFIGSAAKNPIALPNQLQAPTSPEEAVRAYLSACGSLFGLGDQAAELQLLRQTRTDDARSVLRFQQVFQGIPVYGAQLVVQLDAAQNVLLVNGDLSPAANLDSLPVVKAASAQKIALQSVAEQYAISSDKLTLNASEPALNLYDPKLIQPYDGEASLVWLLTVSQDGPPPVSQLVLVDARSGAIAWSLNLLETAKNRNTYTLNNTTTYPGTLVCDEASPDCTGGDADAVNAHVYSGYTYDFYWNYHGRDGIDNAGMTINSYVHFSTDYCNSFWNGDEMRMTYGDGCFIVVDDIVAHEITHGVTQFESDVIYAYESGAIDESFSDIWGEWIDLTNGKGNDTPAVRWLIGEDISAGAQRNMKYPTVFGDPDRMLSPFYYYGVDDNGGVHTNNGVGNKAAYLITDGDTFNGYTVTGLGISKAAKIYYEAQTNILTPGADYYTMYLALYQACNNLIVASSITADDCTQVRNATLATEMNQTHPAESNDDFHTPTVISGLPYTNTQYDTDDATNALSDPLFPCTGEENDNTVWYRYTPGVNITLVFDTLGSDYDTVLGVWTDNDGSLDSVACNDNVMGSIGQSQVVFAATAGRTYFIEIAGQANEGGSLMLNASVMGDASNDDFNAPTVIDGLPYISAQNIADATQADDDPFLTCARDGQRDNSVWYSYTPDTTAIVKFDTFGSGYDTVLGVWTGSRGSLTQVACNDISLSVWSQVSFAASAGVTYYIEVAGFGDTGGSMKLTLHGLGEGATTWKTKTPMSVARRSPAAASVEGKVYVIGGQNSSGDTSAVEEYDPVADTWTSKADKPTAVYAVTAAVINNKIYVPGGWHGSHALAAVEVYDPALDSWSSVASMPVALYAHAVAAVGGKLYVINASTCYVYDPAANNWSACAAMNYARAGAAAGVVNGKIYVVGGWDDEHSALPTVEEYDPVTDTWATKSPLGTPREQPGAVGYGSYLYVCGSDDTTLTTCEKYDPRTNSWSPFDSFGTGRESFAMAEANGKLYAEGGYNDDYLAVNEENAAIPPSMPTHVAASEGVYTDKVRVSWDTLPGATYYEVYRAENSSSTKSLVESPAASPYADTGTPPGVTYYYWVKACNGFGCSDYSADDTGWRNLTAPIGVTASDGAFSDKVQITWTAAAGATSYQVFRATSAGGIKSLLASAAASPYKDTSATAGISYFFWVKACRLTRCSDYSANDTGWRNLISVTASDGIYIDKVQITWTNVTGATSYRVYRAASASGAKTLLGSPAASPYNDTTAAPGVTYYYWVKTCTGVSCSNFSTSDTGWRKLASPAKVAASDGTFTDKVQVIWTAAIGATSYNRHYSE